MLGSMNLRPAFYYWWACPVQLVYAGVIAIATPACCACRVNDLPRELIASYSSTRRYDRGSSTRPTCETLWAAEGRGLRGAWSTRRTPPCCRWAPSAAGDLSTWWACLRRRRCAWKHSRSRVGWGRLRNWYWTSRTRESDPLRYPPAITVSTTSSM